MSDARSQLSEVDALLASAPDDPALQQLRDDLLQLIALEEHEIMVTGAAQPSSSTVSLDLVSDGMMPLQPLSESASSSHHYSAQGTFLEHNVSNSATVAEAPELGSFQPVVKNTAKSPPVLKRSYDGDDDDDDAHTSKMQQSSTANVPNTTSTPSTEKKTKKKKKAEDDANAVLDTQFELPSHLVPLESDTPAQRLKKQRTAKALKSKFREKQKEAEHAKRQNDWKSFATKAGGKKRKGVGGGVVGNASIFSTEDGVHARVGVISGGGGRTMTNFVDPNKRHK
jgi:hypothetical protein